MFLKQKRCGRVKGRGCTDGRKQRVWTNKEDATSPTVSTEAVLLTSVIEAKERREVMTVDIPGAFMQGEQDETVHMKLEGPLAELLARCDPTKYQPYSIGERKTCAIRRTREGTLWHHTRSPHFLAEIY